MGEAFGYLGSVCSDLERGSDLVWSCVAVTGRSCVLWRVASGAGSLSLLYRFDCNLSSFLHRPLCLYLIHQQFLPLGATQG